jgi:hypothetical protein
MKKKSDPKVDKWHRWLKIIDEQIYEFLWARYVFLQIQTIFKKNRKLQNDDYFFEWLRINFSKSISVAVRRQLDCDSSVITLGRLLFEIQQSPNLLTYEDYELLFTDGFSQNTDSEKVFYSVRQKIARREFNEFSGRNKNQVNPLIVCKDIAKLNDSCAPIKRYVNKRIAHHDKQTFTAFPSYKELYLAIDTIVAIHKKYTHLIRGIPYEIKIEPQWNWKEIFKYAWQK